MCIEIGAYFCDAKQTGRTLKSCICYGVGLLRVKKNERKEALNGIGRR